MSEKAQLTARYCGERGIACVAPTLHHHPNFAAAQIRALMPANPDAPCAFIGSSMGGFFAAYFCEMSPRYRAVLINPAVRLADKLRGYVGQTQKNYHNDEEYVFTQSHLDALESMTVSAVSCPQRYFLLAQKGDEVLDWREAAAYYAGARQEIGDGGDHSFTNYADCLPAVIDFVTARA